MVYEISATIKISFTIQFVTDVSPDHERFVVKTADSPVSLASENPVEFTAKVIGSIEASTEEEALRVFHRKLGNGWYVTIGRTPVDVVPTITVEDITIEPLEIEETIGI